MVVFAVVLIFYIATRFYALEEFPIYFFCDEAIQANIAQNLVENGLRDHLGRLLPAYFLNVDKYSLSLTVWIYALPVALFGKSILVVRATSVCIGLFGVASVMLVLKWFFSSRLWWAGGLVMAALPAWFIHSRTGFETPFMVSFYAMFLLTYLLYREHSPRWLPAAVVAGAATFYSYTNGQGVMFLSCLLLLIVDWPYHRRVIKENRRAFSSGVLAIVLVSAPYLHFRFVRQPEIMVEHLKILRSYWVTDQPLTDKLATFGSTYLRGLSPGYWFSTENGDLIRHRLLGQPHLPLWLAPEILLGLAGCVWRSRGSAPHRLVLIALLAAPFSASLVGLEITRVLAAVVPATLCAVLGLDILQNGIQRWVPTAAFATVVGVGLVAASSLMTTRAVRDGGTWFDDYGLYGMQWGAKQVFERIRENMGLDPNGRFVIGPLWANNPGAFGDFFLTAEERDRIRWAMVEDLVKEEREEVNPSNIFVLPVEDYGWVTGRPEFDVGVPREILRFPNGEPGFYFVQIAYSEHARALMEARLNPRKGLVEGEVLTQGGRWLVLYPELDNGVIDNAFDGNLETLARTREAPVTVVEVEFPGPRVIEGVRFHLWYDKYEVSLVVVRAGGEVVKKEGTGGTHAELRPFELLLSETVPDAVSAKVTITKTDDGHVHLREIEFLPKPPTESLNPS